MEGKEKLKRGQKPVGWKNDCAKFPEYYKKRHPEWTDSECRAAANEHNKSTCWQNIEYWIKKYPELTIEECEQKLLEAKKTRNSKSATHIEFYELKYPGLSHEEHERMLNEHCKKYSKQSIKYYELKYPGLSHEEHERMRKEYVANYTAKRPDNSGVNNPAHHSKTTELERKQRSPKCIEFYELKYPGLSHEEHERMLNEHISLVNSKLTPDKICTKIEYWIAKGYTEKEAREKLIERQRTFTLDKCISKYGEIKGRQVFEERQEKWQKTLHDSFRKTNKGISQSTESNNLFSHIKLNGFDIEQEFQIGRYSFDCRFQNKLIEFNGDYWHANPDMYDENFFNKVSGLTARKIWKKDEAKYEYAIKHGYKVLVIWESEYNEDFDKTLNKCMQFLND